MNNHEAPGTEEIAGAAARFYAALNAMFEGDLAPMVEVWSHADDVTYMGPDGGFQVGWKQVLADWEKQAAMNLSSEDQMEKTVLFWQMQRQYLMTKAM